MREFKIAGLLFLLGVLMGCNSSNEDETDGQGKVTIEFQHLLDGEPTVFDEMIYENAAGNVYEITNIQWFISDLTLVAKDGGDFIISGDDLVHYIDTDIPDSHSWTFGNGIPAKEYISVRFTFGIKGENNQPNKFSNPPESNMIWPYHMGGDEGGYHYMKLNGFWKNIDGDRTPFNFHIGVGQIYDSNGDITGFVQNWRTIEVPGSAFTLLADETINMVINMNIENWFKSPHIYDHNIYGGQIMDNQEAMGKIKDNCDGVYTISFKENEGEKAD